MEIKPVRQQRSSAWALGRIMIVVLAAALSLTLVFRNARAKDVVSVRISGPGIDGQLEFFDEETAALFRNLETAPFVPAPSAGLSDLVFEIQVGVGDGNLVFAYNVYLYSPPLDGNGGHLYFADVINGWSSAESTWFPLSDRSDRALRVFLASHGGSGALVGLPGQPDGAVFLSDNFAVWMAFGLAAALVLGTAFANRATLGKQRKLPARTQAPPRPRSRLP